MPVLVTGATGYIGGAVARALIRRGEQVRLFVRTDRELPFELLGATICKGDLLDAASVQRAVDGCSTIYYVAPWPKGRVQPNQLCDLTVHSADLMCKAALACGVEHLIYTSSFRTMGPKRGETANEDTPHRGVTLSADEAGKLAAEQVVMSYVARGLPAVILNPAMVYGPGDPHGIGLYMAAVANRKLRFMFDWHVGLVYIDDVASAHIQAAERGSIGHRYVLSERVMSYHALCAEACRLAGVPLPIRLPFAVAACMAAVRLQPWEWYRELLNGLRVDGSKAAHQLGLQYTPFEIGLQRTLNWQWESGLLQHRPGFLG